MILHAVPGPSPTPGRGRQRRSDSTTRLSRFVAVGGLGFAVQMTAATLLLASGVAPLLATLLAIEAAIIHNHAWHRRWAWKDRASSVAWITSFTRAHLGAGGTSLVVGVGTVAALSNVLSPIAAQVVAVGLCAVLNYWLADRFVFRAGAGRRVAAASVAGARRMPVTFFALAMLLALPVAARADAPSPAALQSWERYAAALSRAREADLSRGVPAWATDDDPRGTAVLAALRRGEVHVTGRTLRGIDVDDATLEHWQGSVLLRGATIAAIAERLRHPERHPTPRDVLALKVSNWSEQGHDVYLRLTRSMLVTATYDTWHRVRHREVDPDRVESVSVSTRIEELHDAGTPKERRVPLSESRGFLWRMQSIWRFTATGDGVIVTCESITLSRPVPFGLGLVSRPIITRVARESMTTAVRAWLKR
ncbi:hypothetical protein TBR22_A11520 [Luteitalea sp. TBR-22]|uniref:GtrA family protein n=1 Tax=Luteitalea sp. TBR-22 TaxID=2802971 RepID=UPI001AF3CF17|nr:GtrA family protein [Luteitalea sp. TBR-22]BCS31948.1 hypothetical protein TBR22_A11520 [Luteitalea sp. TBR-22]